MNKWSIHRGYLQNPAGLPIADELIFVKHKERSFEAVALFTGKQRKVFKKDQDSLFKFLSKPKVWDDKDKIKRFLYEYPNMMNKKFEQNKLTKEVKVFLQGIIENE